MKRALVLTVILLLTAAGANAADRFTRVGLTFLGTGFLSATVEYGYGDASVRLRAGVFEFQEICFTTSVHRYFDAGSFRTQVGAGVWNILIFPEGNFGRLTFLTVPVGVEREFAGRTAVGLEGDINCFLNGRDPGGGPVSWKKKEDGFRRRLLPLPALYSLYRI